MDKIRLKNISSHQPYFEIDVEESEVSKYLSSGEYDYVIKPVETFKLNKKRTKIDEE